MQASRQPSATIFLTNKEWEEFEKKAKLSGFKLRAFMRKEMHRLHKELLAPLEENNCKNKSTKRFDIPEELQDFFYKLASEHGIPVCSVISRYIVFPHVNHPTQPVADSL